MQISSEEQWALIAERHPSARAEASTGDPNAWLCLHCGAVANGSDAFAELGPLLGVEPDPRGYEAARAELAARGVDSTADGPSLMEAAAGGDKEAIETIKSWAPWLIPPESSEAEAQAIAARLWRDGPPR